MLGTLENQQVSYGDLKTIHHAFVDKDVFILKKPQDFDPNLFKKKLEDLRSAKPEYNLNRGKVFIFYNENDIELYTYKEDKANKSDSNSIPNVEFEKINIFNDDDKKIYTICLQAKVFLDKPEGIIQWSPNPHKESFYPQFIIHYDNKSIGLKTDHQIKYQDGDQERYCTLFPKKINVANHLNTPSTPIFKDPNKSQIADISDILTGSLSIQSVGIFYDGEIPETQRDNNKSQEALLNEFFNDRLSIFNKKTKKSVDQDSKDRIDVGEETLISKLVRDGETQTDQTLEAKKADQQTQTDQPIKTEAEKSPDKANQQTQTPITIAGLQIDSQSDTDDEEHERRRFSRASSIAPNFSKEEDHKKHSSTPSSNPSITGTNHLITDSIDHIYTKLRIDQLKEYLTELNVKADNFSKYDHLMPTSFKIAPKSEYAGFGLKIECDYSSNTLCVIDDSNYSKKNLLEMEFDLKESSPINNPINKFSIQDFFKSIEAHYKVSRKDKEAMDCAITCFFRNRALNDDKMTLRFEDDETQILQSKTCLIKNENGKTKISTQPFSDDSKNRIEGRDRIYIEEIIIKPYKTSHRSYSGSL